MLEIYHNPRCSKSRQALALLESANIAHRVRLYLKDSPSFDELKAILQALGDNFPLAVRSKDAGWKELAAGINDKDLNQLCELLCANIRYLQRPLAVFDDGSVVIGRPPEDIAAAAAKVAR